MTLRGPILVRMVGMAVSLGLPGDPEVWREMPAKRWLEARSGTVTGGAVDPRATRRGPASVHRTDLE